MLILALDSTATAASVAVCQDERPLASFTVDNGNTHSETLLPMIQAVLHTLSLTADDIDLFACTAGPGSFTGVRIGAATIKGLAFAKEKPCIGVSSLESLACACAVKDGIICPVINARKFVYYALFCAKDGKLTRLCEDDIVAIGELDAAVSAVLATADPTLPIYLTGDGWEIAQRALPSLSASLQETPVPLRGQNACCIAQLALKALREGNVEDFSDRTLAPVYLRPCQAERDTNERLNAKS